MAKLEALLDKAYGVVVGGEHVSLHATRPEAERAMEARKVQDERHLDAGWMRNLPTYCIAEVRRRIW